MKNIKKFIILLLLLLPLACAQDFSNYQSINVNLSINSYLDVISASPDSSIRDLEAVISLSPKEDTRQKIISSKTITNPSAQVDIGDEIYLYWDEIKDTDKIYFNFLSEIQTTNVISKISSQINYPFSVDSVLMPYIQENEFIDINSEIKNKALELSKDKTDLYEVVFAIANWTNYNVKYDLATITAEAIQKSSWVFKNRKGVCDEITNLFISLLRSIGIPARFIAGTVHSNTMKRWGNHGWAEVYFPGYGWIPFDITFGQYGWIDPSHVKLSESIDSVRPTINYKWRAANARLNPSRLNIETNLKSTNGPVTPQISIDIQPVVDKVGFNSFIPLKVTIRNLMNYYLIPRIYLTKSPEATTSPEEVLFLKPKEKKTFFWLLKLPTYLNQRNRYTSKIEVNSSFSSSATSEIKISDAYKTLTLEESLKQIDFTLTKESKPRFSDLTITCKPTDSYYYSRTNIDIKCSIENKGNAKDLNLCIQGVCQKTSVAKTKEISLQTLAEQEIEIYVEDEKYIKYANVQPEIVQVPNIQISGISPLNMDYNKDIDLKFTLITNYPAHNVKIYANNKNIYETALLNQEKNINIKLNSKFLVSSIKLEIVYEDNKRREYTTAEKYLTTVNNAPFYRRLLSWLI